MATDFIVHDEQDHVGVVVVEGVSRGQTLKGWVMATDETIEVVAGSAIPIGHKVAVVELEAGSTVLKYGHDIGRTTAAIGRGDHLHVHNTKTKRW